MSTPPSSIDLLDALDQALAGVAHHRRPHYDGAFVGILAGILAQTDVGREAWTTALGMLTRLVDGTIR